MITSPHPSIAWRALVAALAWGCAEAWALWRSRAIGRRRRRKDGHPAPPA